MEMIWLWFDQSVKLTVTLIKYTSEIERVNGIDRYM